MQKKGLFILDENQTIIENNLKTILNQFNLTASDISKLTGVSRQFVNFVIKNKVNPGIEFLLKVSYILNVPVENIFSLKQNIWYKPAKSNNESTLYLDFYNLTIIDGVTLKKDFKNSKDDYIDTASNIFISEKEYIQIKKEYLSQNDDLIGFNSRYVKRFKKLVEKFEPIQLKNTSLE